MRAAAPWLRSALKAPPAHAQSADQTASWMTPRAKTQDLLYVSNTGNDEVDVYAYPSDKPAGLLAGLGDPAGLCTDAAGSVWIVEAASARIVKYAHGGKKSKTTLSDSGALDLLGCAVDPTTGNLAVTDLGGPSGGGGVWIYPNAKGPPKQYTISALQAVYFAGYDDQGNLFVDGLGAGGKFALAELVAGGSSLESISLDQTVDFPGGIGWDGEYLAIGDQAFQGMHTSAIYQVSVTGSTGTVEGTTSLTGSCDVLQFGFASAQSNGKRNSQDASVVAPDVCLNDASFYPYPAGGSPSKTLTALQYPVAAVFSVAAK
jgi:hypothetical protein